jgi:peptidoglycan/xylan/chitin deacetylase (PgdA/CDA1 family)
MRVIALIAAYNERRFIGGCLEHLERHGVDAYLIDNCSTDNTVELAEGWLGRNLIGMESFPRGAEDLYDWRGILERKEQLAQELEADWFIHMDPDEIRLPPASEPGRTLLQAFEAVERAGSNAVDFAEFTFIPTREEPDHDHPRFQETMRWYYNMQPNATLHQLKAWKAQPEVELHSGGHRVSFPGLKVHPEQFRMKHYLFLSARHAAEKYVQRKFNPEEVASGWHGWRAKLTHADLDVPLPPQSELMFAASDDELDSSAPRQTHYVETKVQSPPPGFHVVRPSPREQSLPERPGAARIVHRGAGDRPEVALTFDDGPSGWTAQVAAAFDAHDCRATFFLRGLAVQERPEAVAALTEAGHELGNHLWSHTRASGQSESELRDEIERTAAAIEAAGAARPALARPPYFDGAEAVAAAAEGTSVRAVVLRSIGTSDWEAHSPEQIVEPVLANVEPGDVVCLHDGISSDKRADDTRLPTVEAVSRLVPALLERGLRPVTVSELLR